MNPLDVVLAEWDDPIYGRRGITPRALVHALARLVRDHDELVTEICERHEGVEYPVDEYGYAELPPDYVSALTHSGNTGDVRRMLSAIERESSRVPTLAEWLERTP